MSSVRLDRLINEFPEEREAVERLARFIEASGEEVKELTLQRIFDIANPSSQRILAKILIRLVEQGVLEKALRVESDSQGGIQDFESVTDIPPVLLDVRTGREIEVRMDQIHLIYKLHPQLTA